MKFYKKWLNILRRIKLATTELPCEHGYGVAANKLTPALLKLPNALQTYSHFYGCNIN